MAYGTPFYNYGANNYGYNGGYTAPQMQPNYLYNNGQQMPQNGNQQPLNAFQQQQGQMAQSQQPVQSVMPPKTNMPLVTSLLDAMNKTVEPNTNTYYADQDQPLIYLVSMDMQGRKTSKTFEVKDITEQVAEQAKQTPKKDIDLSAYATKDDLKALKDEITSYAMSFFNSQPAVNSAPTPISTPTQTVASKPKTAEKTVKKEDKE